MLEESILYQRVSNVARLASDELAWFSSFTYDVKTEILNLIRQDQLTEKGVDEAGNIIGYYSYLTELITNGRKQEGDPYDLNDSGTFYRSMVINVFRDSFVIDAGSSSFNEMQKQEWYSDSILGLTDENLQKTIDKIKEKYREQMEQLLFGLE